MTVGLPMKKPSWSICNLEQSEILPGPPSRALEFYEWNFLENKPVTQHITYISGLICVVCVVFE